MSALHAFGLLSTQQLKSQNHRWDSWWCWHVRDNVTCSEARRRVIRICISSESATPCRPWHKTLEPEVMKIYRSRMYKQPQVQHNPRLHSSSNRGYRIKVMTNKSSFIAEKYFYLFFVVHVSAAPPRVVRCQRGCRMGEQQEICEKGFYVFKIKLHVVYYKRNVSSSPFRFEAIQWNLIGKCHRDNTTRVTQTKSKVHKV